MLEFILVFNCSNENKFGSVGGSKENPDTFAFQLIRISESHEPLNPVCPVIKIFFPLKKFFIVTSFFISICTKVRFYYSIILAMHHGLVLYPCISKIHHVYML